jgi:hypothetical protein
MLDTKFLQNLRKGNGKVFSRVRLAKHVGVDSATMVSKLIFLELLTFATSTMSRMRQMASPLCSKFTVIAMNARWFGEVQASVIKCSLPSCFW